MITDWDKIFVQIVFILIAYCIAYFTDPSENKIPLHVGFFFAYILTAMIHVCDEQMAMNNGILLDVNSPVSQSDLRPLNVEIQTGS